MKNINKIKIILLILMLSLIKCAHHAHSSSSFTNDPCPKYGEYNTKHDSIQNTLKNRSISDTNNLSVITYKQMLTGKNLNTNMYVCLKNVYIVKIKRSSGEECNCHTKDTSMMDFHILVSNKLGNLNDSNIIIVETTRYSKIWNIKQFLNKKINLYGFLFNDDEHKNAATFLVKNCKNCWRANTWELHPLLKVELSK